MKKGLSHLGRSKQKTVEVTKKISASTEIFIFREIIKVKTYGFLFIY